MATKIIPHKDIKNLEMAYTTEHLEMALYRQLQIIAEQAGDKETAIVCKDILEDEMNAARILEDLMQNIF